MVNQVDGFWYKLRIAICTLLIIGGLPFLSLLPPVPELSQSNAKSQPRTTMQSGYIYSESNNVGVGVFTVISRVRQAISDASQSFKDSTYSIALTTYGGLRKIGHASHTGLTYVAIMTGKGASYAAHSFIDGTIFIVRSVGSIAVSLTEVPTVSAYIRPADSAELPVIGIDPLPEGHDHSELAIGEDAHTHEHPQDNKSYWPIAGRITTYYGVPHYPFQPTHTGIDISSGHRSGVTPVRPFKSGVVLDTVHSGRGLGNHVIIDHGDGLTSTYAHLASIAATKGQTVTTDTIIGQEGTTGVSTGTHLHFEVRLHGKAVDPLKYLNNQ